MLDMAVGFALGLLIGVIIFIVFIVYQRNAFMKAYKSEKNEE